jgi:hypothetical protein
MGISRENGARPNVWLIVSAASIGWGVATIAVLHLISSHNPVFDTLSSYAYTDRGTGMLAAGMLSLSFGSAALLGALRAGGIRVTRTTGLLFCTWSLGLATAALFPASYPDHPHVLSGEIHQYSCLIALLSLPAIGFSLLEKFHDAPLIRRTVASAGSLVVFGASYLCPWLLPIGLTQRIALGIDVALLCRLLTLVRAAERVAT